MFREYTDEDRSSCINILHSNTPRYFAPQDYEDFCAFLASPSGIYSVLEDHEGVIVGCGGISTRKHGQEGILTWGMIHATRQRQGWGRLLTLARFSQLNKIASVKTITLHTSQETVGFYEKLGFRTVTFTHDYYSAGLHRYDMEIDVDERFRQLYESELWYSQLPLIAAALSSNLAGIIDEQERRTLSQDGRGHLERIPP